MFDLKKGFAVSDQNTGSNSASTASAIVFVGDDKHREILINALNQLGIAKPTIVTDEMSCIDEMQKIPSSWVVLDLASGVDVVVRILVAAQGDTPYDVSPILLLSPEAEQKILCIALEYNVGKIHMGDLAAEDAGTCFSTLAGVAAENVKLGSVMAELSALRKASKWKDGNRLLLGALEENPNHEHFVIELAENYFLSGDFAGAQSHIQSLVQSSPNNLRAVHVKSRILMAQRKFPEAIELLASAERKSQYSADRMIALGGCYLQIGKFKEARTKFNTALKIDQSSIDAKQGLVQTDLLTGNMDEALQMARSLGTSVDVAKTLNMTAVIAIHNNKIDNALQMYEQSITFLESHPLLGARVWFNLGLIHHRASDLDRASICFKTSCGLDPTFKGAAQNLRVVTRLMSAKSKNSIGSSHTDDEMISEKGNQYGHEGESIYGASSEDHEGFAGGLRAGDDSVVDDLEDVAGDTKLFK
jgi:tetratricopeptide (TPR) repeat protein